MSWRFQKPGLRRSSSEQSPLLPPHRQNLHGTFDLSISNIDSPKDSKPTSPNAAGDGSNLFKPVKVLRNRASFLTRLLESVVETGWSSESLGVGNRKYSFRSSSYEKCTSVDWLQDNPCDRIPVGNSRKRSGTLAKFLSNIQGCVLAAIVGMLVACVAFLINILEPSLYDLKFGYCSTSVLSTRRQCCSGKDNCSGWTPWGRALSFSYHADNELLNLAFYVIVMLVLASGSCILVIMESRVTRHRDAVDYRVIQNERKTQNARNGRRTCSYNTEEISPHVYTCSGSGVAEVKVIASGFVIQGYLGARTFVIKTLACILSVSSGLSVGKEGPFVHLAACVGYNVSQMFPAYRGNANKRRGIISASSAAGLAVAFGTPIAGVLFSLEEVSYHFSTKILFRTFFCAIVAIVTLKFLDLNGNPVFALFQTEKEMEWGPIEMIIFISLGILGGATGAIMVKGIRFWARAFRSLPMMKKWPLLEVLTISLITAFVSYWNIFSALPVEGLMSSLASSCNRYGRGQNDLCPEVTEVPSLIYLLFTSFIIKGLLTTISFGLKIPAGIYMPSMAVGALLGRAVGHSVQYLIAKHGNSSRFSYCALDGHLESCVVPGVYTLVTAGATMCGVTRLTLTLAVMLFELTGSLEHVAVFSMAILAAKWTADFMEPQSIYDFYLDESGLPYLRNTDPPRFTCTLGDITASTSDGTIVNTKYSPRVPAKELREKLRYLQAMGQSDGALPILHGNSLIGLISCQDLELCLGRMAESDNLPCLVSPRSTVERGEEEVEEAKVGERETDPTDFTAYIDPAPLAMDVQTSNHLVYECFVKMGIRYICILSNGRFIGLLRKKVFVEYARHIGQGCMS